MSLYRRLSRLRTLDKNKLVGLYEKMRLTMEESEDKKPGFLEVAKLIWCVNVSYLQSLEMVILGLVNTAHLC